MLCSKLFTKIKEPESRLRHLVPPTQSQVHGRSLARGLHNLLVYARYVCLSLQTVIEEPGLVYCDWLVLPLLLSTFTGVVSGIGKKWNRSDSFDSDSIDLVTPLATPIFGFH